MTHCNASYLVHLICCCGPNIRYMVCFLNAQTQKRSHSISTIDSHELMSNKITNYDANKIIEAIMQVVNYEGFLQHYLAADNVYADSEFCDSNVFD